MKKLIAIALFLVSAMTMSAQGSALIIQTNGITDAEIKAVLQNTNYALVSQDDPALKAAVEEINKQVLDNKIQDKNTAVEALEEAVKELEIKAGDANVDGKVNVGDVNTIIAKSKLEYDPVYDLNNDGKINIGDINYVIAQSKK